MGLWDWIKNAAKSASVGEKERAYWWVSEARRSKCRKLLDDAWRNANALTLPWDAWHKCMQQEPKPISEYKIVKDFTFLVNFIKELVGIKEITVEPSGIWIRKEKVIPPRVIRGINYVDCVRNKKSDIYNSEGCRKYREKIERQLKEGKRIEEAIREAERKPKPKEEPRKFKDPSKPKDPIIIRKRVRARKPRKPADRSHLNFNLFSGALKWRNIKKPDFLLKFENMNDKILEEISMITGEKK